MLKDWSVDAETRVSPTEHKALFKYFTLCFCGACHLFTQLFFNVQNKLVPRGPFKYYRWNLNRRSYSPSMPFV